MSDHNGNGWQDHEVADRNGDHKVDLVGVDQIGPAARDDLRRVMAASAVTATRAAGVVKMEEL